MKPKCEICGDYAYACECGRTPEQGLYAQSWVSVKDRLPAFDQGIRVLVYTDGVDFAGEQFFVMLADDLYDHEADEVSVAVTHWMPLPSRPIAKQGE